MGFAGKDNCDQVNRIISIMGTPRDEALRWLPENSSGRRFMSGCPIASKSSWDQILPSSSTSAHEALDAMLCFDPTVRATVRDLLSLRYFEKYVMEGDMEKDTRLSSVDWSF